MEGEGLITYRVTAVVKDPTKIPEWIKFMKHEHIPEVENTGYLEEGSGEIFQKNNFGNESSENLGNVFEINYFFQDEDTLNEYRTTHGHWLKEHYEKLGWGEETILTREVLLLVD